MGEWWSHFRQLSCYVLAAPHICLLLPCRRSPARGLTPRKSSLRRSESADSVGASSGKPRLGSHPLRRQSSGAGRGRGWWGAWRGVRLQLQAGEACCGAPDRQRPSPDVPLSFFFFRIRKRNSVNIPFETSHLKPAPPPACTSATLPTARPLRSCLLQCLGQKSLCKRGRLRLSRPPPPAAGGGRRGARAWRQMGSSTCWRARACWRCWLRWSCSGCCWQARCDVCAAVPRICPLGCRLRGRRPPQWSLRCCAVHAEPRCAPLYPAVQRPFPDCSRARTALEPGPPPPPPPPS